MDQTLFNNFEALGAIGSALTGIVAILGIGKYFSSLKVKSELLYGEEADERLAHIKEHFKDGSFKVLPTLPYNGRDIINPRLVISKITSGSKTVSKDWKGKTALIKYYRPATAAEQEAYKAKNSERETPSISIERWLI